MKTEETLDKVPVTTNLPVFSKVFWPILYKKSSGGAITQWQIAIQPGQDIELGYGVIIIEWGQVGGAMQITRDVVKEGKNTAKKNATTPCQQAYSEAESKYTKQLKKGFVTKIEDAQAGTVDSVIEGGVSPMLAHPHAKHGHKIVYPCAVQGKLDGVRCIAVIENGKASLWSRTRKRINSIPHIERALEALFPNVSATIDGELYNHQYHDNFEEIISLVRKDEPSLDGAHEAVQYHIYDCVMNLDFEVRLEALNAMAGRIESLNLAPLKIVATQIAHDDDQMMQFFNQFVNEKYEGLMARNLKNSPYEYKRSYNLQKVKEFLDDEFKIVGLEEGRGKLAGHVGAFVLVLPDGRTFNAKPMGAQELSKQYWENPESVIGKMATVKYQNLTQDGIPRFPVAKSVRDYE